VHSEKLIQIAFKYPESEDCYVLNLTEKGTRLASIDEVWRYKNAFVFAAFDFFRTGKLHVFLPDSITKSSVDNFSGLGKYDINNQKIPENTDTSQDSFLENVKAAKRKMKNSTLEKVALSRVKSMNLMAVLSPDEVFTRLCRNFPNAFVFYVNSPATGIWAGATPECLLSVRDNSIKSMSLAGTLSDADNNQWTGKEFTEQNIVTEYIRKVFLDSGFESVSVSSPNVLKIGNLNHLKTDFSAAFSESDEHKLSDFIALLHPTPAVGGYPKNEAIQFIENVELHKRLYYTGFSGMINFKHGSDLFVNLRLFQVFRKSLTFYAGAGITDASDAEKEWNETENKIQMTAALFADYY
jgi:isochorismate synthase